jgi:hypothetical protein
MAEQRSVLQENALFASDLREPLFDERFKPLVSKHRPVGVVGQETWSKLAERPRRIWGDTIKPQHQVIAFAIPPNWHSFDGLILCDGRQERFGDRIVLPGNEHHPSLARNQRSHF